MNKKIHIETLGCRLNQIESESVAAFFSDDGFTVAMKSITSKDKEDSDCVLCVVNTCTVTAKAEQKARRIIRLLLKKYPSSIVVVTGCYAQVNKEEISAIDERVVVLPGRVKSRLADVPSIVSSVLIESENNVELIQKKIKEHLESKVLFKPVTDTSENPFKLSTDTFLHHSRSSIKIQDGCNCRCSYCEICIARGKSVSLEVSEVLKQVEKLIAAGQKEIVITTVNIAQYKSEYEGKIVDIAGLLEILLNKTKGVSFRFSSLYPQIVDERLCELIKDERVRPHFHLSVQSGSDEVLLKMNRPYKAQAVIDACNRLKAAKKNPYLACDIIAGFPGERDEDFKATMNLIKECGFTWVHAFPFSPRPNTVAFTMKPKVPEFVTGKRVDELLEYSFESKINYINSLKGTVHKAIVETSHNLNALKIRDGKKVVHAVSDNFLHCVVLIDDGKEIPFAGSEVDVEIVSPLIDEIKRNGEQEVLARLT
ncbi:MAG: tRNA (N(6)-L-threonylcarbamoyladenosine(37)-C(2))-methylthiotransferase MtaB [Treponema sp.]|uniref:tRNA (N(6)-L-threonylcarbamoyladenosine(37)-C(2))- methylthiotransferase MtaB n=1 Tax=Treponema sp. TaxID=166 RepID=UPI001D7E169E|nr:tRNA (N(6)-L-threonylcarbamoyladenosine(37)-C(2))-methylthiotransferase MtaB [Treponema sp.]MBS7310767.1 tRNA (N(6)-L-threonylcarbamoyladenosine(37)-C(2))-methylthiotransferase MtaB [Treponema sp.]